MASRLVKQAQIFVVSNDFKSKSKLKIIMTNFNDKSKQILNKYQQKEQKLALIPPARIRTPSNQHQLRDLPLVNEQNMKPSEVSNPSLGNEVWSSVEDLFWVSVAQERVESIEAFLYR